MRTLLLISFILFKTKHTLEESLGPVFIEEPPNVIEFSNNSGTIVECKAEGEPKPLISWKCNNYSLNSKSFDSFRNEIMVRSDGALIFSPFSPQKYVKAIHSWAPFQCIATNKFGSIASREVRVNAVMMESMDIRVYDVFVLKGNVAVLKCLNQNVISHYIANIIWHISDGFLIKANETKGKYTVYPNGELHIRSVDENDFHKTYRCEVRNILTAQSILSERGGQLILSEQNKIRAPKIVHTISELTVEENEEKVMIACAAEANPLPQYTWHKTSKFGRISPIETSQRIQILDGTLIMSQISASDSARYLAIASNSVGEDRCVTDLTVRSALKVIAYPNGVLQTTRGQNLNISCRAHGFPIDSLYWTHNLKIISQINSNNNKNINNKLINLYIEAIQVESIGMYQCFASNNFESVQTTLQINLIDESPRIVHMFKEKFVNSGTSVSIGCAAIASPLAQIQWTVDGHSLPNLIRYRSGDYVTNDNKVISYVNITSIQVEDGGRYRCTANNSIGYNYYENRINVYGPPAVKSPNNSTILSGKTVQLFCPYYGYPISAIEWFNKDGKSLPYNGRQLILSNGSLIINSINKKADEGLYECVVRQKHLMAKGQIYLKVMVRPRIDAFDFPQDLEEGMRNVVICAVIAGDSPISIKWLKDGHQLPNDLQVEMVNEFTSSITFHSLRPTHSGEYTCIASNYAANTNHSSKLSVNMAPIWLREPVDVEVIVGQSVVIDCQAEGIPEPQIRWKRMQIDEKKTNGFHLIESTHNYEGKNDNFKTITSNPHIQILENGSLIIKEVNHLDQNKYICSAFNGVNPSISTIIKIVVKSPPQFTHKLETISVRKKETIRLECNPIADEKESIEFQWKKNSISISSNSERYSIETKSKSNFASQLIISSAERLDSALFTCVAINRFGSDEKNFRVIVQELPDPPFHLKSKSITSNSAYISWSKPYDGNSLIIEYNIEYKLIKKNALIDSSNSQQISTTDTSHQIKNLLPFTTYDIRVVAINSLGRGEFSEIITITTLEEPPSEAATDITITAISARCLKVRWKKPKTSLGYTPTIKGYYVGYRLFESGQPFTFKTIDASLETDREEYEINNLLKSTKYEIRVQAFNSIGSGPSSQDMVAQTLEFDVPNAPIIRVLSTTPDSIQLEWSVYGDEPISGFIISYRGEDKEWKVIKISTVKTFTIDGLKCGARYQIYINAFNAVGQGDSSDVILARTEGNVAEAPSRAAFIITNSSAAQLNLSSWKSRGCKIDYFIIRYKKQTEEEWNSLESIFAIESEKVIISDLKSSQWYDLLVKAVSEAGTTDAEYVFSTLTTSGATIAPFVAQNTYQFGNIFVNVTNTGKWLLSQLNFVIPISCALIIVILVTVVICILQFKNNSNQQVLRLSKDEIEGKLQNELSNENICRSHSNSVNESFSGIVNNVNSNQSIYLPIPYATSRIGFGSQSNRLNDSEDSVDYAQQTHVYDVPFIMKKVNKFN